MPREAQGVSASLVNTIINYSISISLGIAGTIDVHTKHGGMNVLQGYRNAWYVGIGISGAGVILACIFAVSQRRRSRKISAEREEVVR